MKPEDFDQLESQVSEMVERSRRNDYFGVAQADLAFHRYIWNASGNRTLYDILDRLTAPLFAFVSILRSSVLDQLSDACSAHLPLIEAMRSGVEEKIKSAFREAIENGYARYMSGPLHDQGRALGFISVPEDVQQTGK